MCSGPIFTKFANLVCISVGVINLTFVLRSPKTKRRLYGNQLILETIRRKQSLLFALACDKELDERKAAFKRLNGTSGCDSGVYDVRLCIAGVNDFTGSLLQLCSIGAALLGTADISNQVCFFTIR